MQKEITLDSLYELVKTDLFNNEKIKLNLGKDVKIKVNFYEKSNFFLLTDILDKVHMSLELNTFNEIFECIELLYKFQKFNISHIDILKQLFEWGPLWDGEIISPSDRDDLLQLGLCTKIVVKKQEGYNACTYKGARYLKLFEYIKSNIRI